MKKFNYFEKKYLLMKKEDDNHKLSNNNCIREHLSKSISLLKELVFIEDFMNIIEINNDESIPSDILKINNLLLKTPTITSDIRHRLYSTTLDCSATPI